MRTPRSWGPDLLVIAALALALPIGLFVLQGDVDVNLYDEGYLWHVTTRTALGDVPMRDVRSYDPGRYYWGAAWFRVLGPGLISLRIGLTAVQCVGLLFGLLTLRRVVRRRWLLGLLGAVLLLWMLPQYRAFESAVVLAFVWLAVRLGEKPVPERYFTAGVGVGLAAFVRIDHGLYGTVGFLLLALFLARRARLLPSLSAWAAGVVIGYAPMLLMVIAVPGFLESFIEYIDSIVGAVARSGNTNLALPIPWPWLVAPGVPLLRRLQDQSVGLLFVTVMVVYPVAAFVALASPRKDSTARRVVLPASLIGVPYVHYAFSRADAAHLAPSILVLVIVLTGLVVTTGPPRRRTVAVMLALMVVLTGLSVGITTSAFRRAVEREDPYVRTRVAGDAIWVPASTADLFHTVRREVDRTLKPGERVLVVPYWPGFYPILGRDSPLRETYFLLPESDVKQREMIARIERQNVRLVVFVDVSMDNRAENHLSRTHPLLFRHLFERFQEIPAGPQPRWLHLLGRKP